METWTPAEYEDNMEDNMNYIFEQIRDKIVIRILQGLMDDSFIALPCNAKEKAENIVKCLKAQIDFGKK